MANAPLRVDGRRIIPDARFEAQHLVLEVDGYAFHALREHLQRDHERQNQLTCAGYRVLRFTWEDLTERPESVIRIVRAGLADPIRHPARQPAFTEGQLPRLR